MCLRTFSAIMTKWGQSTFIFLTICMLLAGCAAERQYSTERLYFIAPTLLPGTRAEMNTAGYWIGRHPAPDRLLMTAEEIDTFNVRIRRELKTVADITAYPASINGAGLRSELESAWQDISKQGLWRSDGSMSDMNFFDSLKQDLNLSGITKSVTTRYALVTGYADQRILPTNEILCSDRGDLNFDKLQNSAYDIGTPLAIVHTSADGKWVYAVAPLSNGWMPSDKVAFCTRDEMTEYLSYPERVVVRHVKADIYRDETLRTYYARARLGTVLPVSPFALSPLDDAASVLVPLREADGNCQFTEMYIGKEEVHAGFLPLTPRSLIRTAFVLLNAPYGWGDMHGEQDCSRFIQQIFAAHGLQFPRNSRAQSQVGTRLDLTQEMPDAEKEMLLAHDGLGGATLLEMSGHIMFYLGSIDGKPYIIHDIWGYRQPGAGSDDMVRVINRVAVTNLELGRGSKRGALISRLRSARVIP